MCSDRKKPNADLKKYYGIFFQIGLIIILVFFLALTKLNLTGEHSKMDVTDEHEIVKMEEIVQTKHKETPAPPPKPPVPVEVPNDEVIEDQILNIDAELTLDEKLETPPPPPDVKDAGESFFVVVEKMPEPKGGVAAIQQCINYPEMARQAGVEGRVIVQFVVSEEGAVTGEPEVVRGIGAGADEEAVRCIKQTAFVPGRQRGKPVTVQMSIPVNFNLGSSR